MATLCTGNSYELSQCSSVNQSNKEYLYVKLTDSALRAIEEYQKNQNSLCAPSIQFLGNEGVLSFPSTTNGCEQKFIFQIQEIDLQGPQGSFECVQQNSQKQLTKLGTLPFRMRIQANDDVYESTKHKMAKETENSKNKCTREIKPNQTDIGRKVKLKPGASRFQHIPANSLQQQQQKRDPYSSTSSNNNFNSLSSSSNGNHVPTAAAATNNLSSNHFNNNSNVNKISSNSHHHYLSSSMTNGHSLGGSSLAAAAPTTTSSNINNNNNNNKVATNQQYHQNSNTISSTTSNNHLNSSSNNVNGISSGNGLVPSRITPTNQHTSNRNQNRSNSAIMKRSLKERLIHLLAIRPYKKPELYAKITNDGIKEKEKNSIALVLKQISFMRDNTYHLHRHIWNDVQEDWPFYTEQDKQTLKRRKPQNLTPPLSSDSGSSGSGHSPDSTHNGSPPPPIKRPPSKGDMSTFDGPIPKKQRISHYKKPDVVNHDTIRRGFHDSRDASNMNPRSREIHQDDHLRSRYYGSNVTPNAQESEELSLSYSVLAQDVANRISSTAALDQGHDHMERDFNDPDPDTNVPDPNEFSGFGRITTVEQRRLYKTEFDNDFREYRELHKKINEVTSRFARLENALRSEEHDDRKQRDIEKQILKEYDVIKDRKFQDKRQRYRFLHRKLSYIKQLVHDFDTTITRSAQESY